MKTLLNTSKGLFMLFTVANSVFLIGLYMFMNEINLPLSRFILLSSALLNFIFYLSLGVFIFRRFVGKRKEY
jgi:hypothetical protein